jgi:hypothetical protein
MQQPSRSETKHFLLLAATVLAVIATVLTIPPAQANELAEPTADQLKIRTSGCETQLSNGKYAHDAGHRGYRRRDHRRGRYPSLQAGSTGAEVKAAQCLLGATNEPSGSFDTATEDAAKSFQA